jgi:hypothetical protein
MAGASIQYLRFTRRADASGLHAGPELSLAMRGRSSLFSQNHAHVSRVWLTPLLGRGLSPMFHSFALGGETAFEILRSGGRRRLDFELALKYFSVRAAASHTLSAVAVSTGFRLWL